MQFVAEELRAI